MGYSARSADKKLETVVVRIAAQGRIYAVYEGPSHIHATLQVHHGNCRAISDEAADIVLCYALIISAGQPP